jgi:hypothetical protein
MAFFKSITTISRNIAVLCVMALPMWALGAPGVENQYAKGWKMGLNVLNLPCGMGYQLHSLFCDEKQNKCRKSSPLAIHYWLSCSYHFTHCHHGDAASLQNYAMKLQCIKRSITRRCTPPIASDSFVFLPYCAFGDQ